MFAPDGLLGRRASLPNKAAQPQLPQLPCYPDTAAPIDQMQGEGRMALINVGKGPSLAVTEEDHDRANWHYRGSHHCQSPKSWRIGILHSTEKRRFGDDDDDWPEEKSRETGMLMAIDTRNGGWRELRMMA